VTQNLEPERNFPGTKSEVINYGFRRHRNCVRNWLK